MSPLKLYIDMVPLVLSRFDYCNSLLTGIPQNLTDAVQKVQKSTAWLIFWSSRKNLVTHLLLKLRWLPISERIKYKLSVICYIISETAPFYLSDLVQLDTPSCSLCSSSDTRLFRISLDGKEISRTASVHFLILAQSLQNNFPLCPAFFNSSSVQKKSNKIDKPYTCLQGQGRVKKKRPTVYSKFNARWLRSCGEHAMLIFCLCWPNVTVHQGQGQNEHGHP